ncbi:hypothetical protein MRS76_13565 [Rhizobiaceae bacterium n13]|uniref:Uncharacterized protein n=1 Tax=Ferirhizobium litorale TaxID=2927786 RepID=A0AAE3U5H4_9HYPH|nr:hypothetical protein [Fererhizobium litorale]MDI7862986.1 hypothetical protein [Fererhizobium litorale]MDI7924059.1 hypothetical protein [Fererhizobium litorale]
MDWALAVSFVIGAICAVRMPVLIFTLIVVAVMFVYAGASYSSGTSVVHAIAWGVALAAVLQAGYVFTHVLLYFFYTRRSADAHKRAPQDIRSKYSAD